MSAWTEQQRSTEALPAQDILARCITSSLGLAAATAAAAEAAATTVADTPIKNLMLYKVMLLIYIKCNIRPVKKLDVGLLVVMI